MSLGSMRSALSAHCTAASCLDRLLRHAAFILYAEASLGFMRKKLLKDFIAFLYFFKVNNSMPLS